MDRALRIRVDDIQFMMDQLADHPSGDILYDKIDFDHIGVFGHSLGGAVAGQLALEDDRIDAGINLDGFQWGDVADATIQQPFI